MPLKEDIYQLHHTSTHPLAIVLQFVNKATIHEKNENELGDAFIRISIYITIIKPNGIFEHLPNGQKQCLDRL